MTFREFMKTFKGNIVSVRDENQIYYFNQESEIEDREVEKITSDEKGVYVFLVKDRSIRVDDFLSICSDSVIRVHDITLNTAKRISREEALIEFCNYKVTDFSCFGDRLVISVKSMKEGGASL